MPATLKGLLPWIYNHPDYQTLQSRLQAEAPVSPQTLVAAATPAVLAALAGDLAISTLVITPSAEESQRLTEALRLWMAKPERILSFPEPPALPYERAPWPPEVIADRLKVFSALFLQQMSDTSAPPPLIVTSLRALIHRTLPYRQFRKAVRKIETGTKESLTGLVRHCQGIGYEILSVVEKSGQISRRGGILDIFPLHAPYPYRLDFFGDEIDAIRTFDPATQRSTGRTEHFWLPPVREALPRDSERALTALQTILERSLPPELRGPMEADAKSLEEAVPFPTLEFYMPFMYQEVSTLLSYLPMTAQVILYNAHSHQHYWAQLEEEALEQRQRAIENSLLLADAPLPYVTWETWETALDNQQTLSLQPGEEGPLAESFTPEPHFAGKLGEAMGRIRQWIGLGDQVVVVSRQASRLADLWREFTPPPVYKALPEPPETLITFVQGTAPGGWQLTYRQTGEQFTGTRHLITDNELFGWRPPAPRRRPRRKVTTPELPFADLKPGDFVVHEDYGIGLFKGLVMRSVDDVDREYLLLEYSGADQIYVPIHQADRLTRYISTNHEHAQESTQHIGPPLSRLGGSEWAETKARVQRATAEIAEELLNLYAARQVIEGHAFAADTAWQAELEAGFSYIETDDQTEAIQAVKKDMEQSRPMDRLICGDAGYGKTEVALRAAFKAVMDNKQVAMLVPTTVLAQQHYQTFQQRLMPFPVKVELLSRFRTPAEQRQVIAGLAQGNVDIIIGTHRLLQKDVVFKDLGMAIIDEEQRFGVTHKEKLKQMRTEVDVLTLTATPIPRTLYMALTGARDVSIIETPPQERLPLSTYVGPYDSDIVRRAIQREVDRGGQIFYVHNRVESIHSVAQRLNQLLPKIRIGTAHGKMRERELAQVMRQFTNGEIDLLLATTIIESGLDYPNANTLIIERADRFGLAQLYQLRGRVGRGTRRGYAYLFHSRKMKDEARFRLQALQETSQNGGGFTIALRDLELRGAGDLLGAKQHGHIAAVGFTLYTNMLTRTVARLKAERAGEPVPPDPIGSITIELPLAVGLPPEYVPDDKLRLQLYRRFAELTRQEEIKKLEEELKDRFGPLPPTAQDLLYQLQLKVLARDARIPTIAIESGQIALHAPWLKEAYSTHLPELRQAVGQHARIGRREIWLQLSWEQQAWKETLKTILDALGQWWEANSQPKSES